jgi:hypothetical protein
MVALVALAACRHKKAAPAPIVKTNPADAQDFRERRSKMTGPRQPGVTSRLAPIRADEVAATLPAPAGARVLHEVAHADIGERIEGAWCYDQGDVAALGAALAQQYTSAGWTDFVVHPNPQLPDHASVTAAKPPYALFGSLERGAREGCSGAEGKTYVSLGVHHLEAVAAPGAPTKGVGPRGTTGLRGP